jgi:hypothetical protein
LADHAVVFIGGTQTVVCTGTSFTFTDAGDLLVLPPKARVVFANGVQVQQEPVAIRLYKRDGTVVVESLNAVAGRA